MLFFWDPLKAQQNVKKHQVSFEVAQTVFEDPLHLSLLDRKKHDEQRWITVGRSFEGHTLVVVHTYQIEKGTELIRIISARGATERERKQYEEGI